MTDPNPWADPTAPSNPPTPPAGPATPGTTNPAVPVQPPVLPPPPPYPSTPALDYSYGEPPTQAQPAYPPAGNAAPGYPTPGYAAPGAPAASYPGAGYPAEGYPVSSAPTTGYGYGGAGYGSYAGYGTQPVYPAFAPPPKTNGLAVASMVLSIAGLVLVVCYGFGVLPGIVGAILGHVARRRIRDNAEGGDGMALAGIIVGWIATGLGLIIVGLIVFAVAWSAQNVNNSSYYDLLRLYLG